MTRCRVVNLRDSKYDVYIGRAGQGQDGTFGNPCRIGQDCPECGRVHIVPGDTIACFETYFLRRVGTDAEFRRRVLELRGKTLGCFCLPRRCHGHVLAAWVNNFAEDVSSAVEET